MDCAVGKPAASRGRRLGPRGRSRRRIAPSAKADDRPRQRSPAGLEAVNVTGTDPEGAGFDTIPAMLSRALVAVFAILAIVGCNQSQAVQAIDKLKPCTGYDTPVDAYCGTLKVYGDRLVKPGRQIDLNIVVLPALRSDAQPDPLFFLAGGPGQGAAKLAKVVREIFRRVQNDRDIVLVDQRGTGKSNPLNCLNDEDDSLQSIMQTNDQTIAKLKMCQAQYDADLTLYTTPIAMDDLDDVRAYLGYEKINVYGGSYGTRAALVYMRQHGDRVRTAILDGVAPPNMRLPLYFPRDTQRAFELLAKDCAADEGCNMAYPNLL